MLEVEVILDFACCLCGRDMGVTLHCAGQGLKGCSQVLASAKVPCPCCSGINEIFFTPDGTLHHVAVHREPFQVPLPSAN